MITVAKKFTPLVEACPIWIGHDVKFFLKAQFAHPCRWIVWGASVHFIPDNAVRNVRMICLHILPDVLTLGKFA